MTSNAPRLGILGGLGPMSTVRFCELLIERTAALCDADHIDMLISSRATTPDRTAFILGKSTHDPLPVMVEEAERLVRGGVDLIVIPCNTAHYFYNGLCEQIKVPMINIIEETVLHLKLLDVKRFGLLATEGTVASRAYERICERHGLICTVPTNEEQATISSMIYNDIKQNRNPDLDRFLEISKRLLASGCERLVLGCTELSLLKKQLPDTLPFTDSLEVLAHRTIVACNKTPIGFPKEFDGEATK